ncbi:MAG: hypothetical protein ACPGVV_03860 [Croceimicrobium sp.]|nr:hypothetical protein [Bacteroidota bacterium]
MSYLPILIYGAFWVVIAIILIILLIRRLRIRDEETFEKRDN